MTLYALTIFLLLAPFMSSAHKCRISTLSLTIITLYISILILFKGYVGTDTASYVYIIDQIADAGSFLAAVNRTEIEPGFAVLARVFSQAITSSILVLNLSALIIVLVFYIVLRKLHGIGRYIFAGVLFSHFVLPYTFNVVRIGLAAALTALGFLYLTQRKHYIGTFLILIATSVQLTSLLIISILLTLRNGISPRNLLFILAFASATFFPYSELIIQKIHLYTGQNSPGDYSGLSTLLLQLSILCASFFIADQRIIRDQLLLFSLSVLCFIIGMNFYAVLRILDLILFTSAFWIAISAQEIRLVKCRHGLGIILILSFSLSAVFFLRNLSMEEQSFDSSSPWIPYHTLFTSSQ